ncbi:MAG: S9 family peptidase [Ignavibacteriales bacterium]|nr:S9 family peptidase [Ignavibacteriales bacterium]MCF8305347.1 S9 family peptidase [Ignavibacteriales bacterium]MCF8436532.1 S9 family peptidase [Ignavibacteriales bacterium]
MNRLLFLTVLFGLTLFGQQKKTLGPEELWQMERLGTYAVSDDGLKLWFSTTKYDMSSNKGNSLFYYYDLSKNELKNIAELSGAGSPSIHPDGRLNFLKDSQLWQADHDGSDAKKLTDIYSGIDSYLMIPGSDKIVFTSAVYPDCDDQDCIKNRDEEASSSKVKAEIFTELLYRHWNSWRGEKRSHLFLYDINTKSLSDLTPNAAYDVPPTALGGSFDFAVSPDGREVAFSANKTKNPSWNTNNDVFIIDLTDPEFEHKMISTGEGNDNQPVYSPDGKYIAFKSMRRPGFEADKYEIIIYDRKTGINKNITSDIDISAGDIVFSSDGSFIFFDAANEINNSVYRINIQTGETDLLIKERVNSDLKLAAKVGRLYFKRQSTISPVNICYYDLNEGKINPVTNLNEEILSKIGMNEAETFWCEGAEGAKVQSVLIKPPYFDQNKKYPMVFLIHGGPQGHWSDDFHFRWNMQMFASRGYVVVAPNPRGSVGYGQKFTDEISGDWGGKAYTDLMNSYDYAVSNFGFIDKENTFAAGASYGGYMINWIAGHTDRFKALVSHAGVFNLESMYGATEELWFPEWEFKGTPWESREIYHKWSPHMFAHNIKTPMLVVHGAFDFRVPEGQAFELFTYLQRLGVKSKFLYFPDEYHFVTKPQNALLWWNTVLGWFDEHNSNLQGK